ncbi:5-(carboxyamino)imidazole ribonucleotide synthase [Candidatus Skiveiella danica]|uniref:5-(carboxyamino)imidazole ribonucleotide synthase n=1 Tax=Candidatus Skiveiella danica TaxID=3386177 RepID=UPI0009D3705E|nr:MAG: N5-carboxyaminoimidazole ribonucleotide synthase [Alphaproteobacteria bacterium ADurb.Bin100]
MNTTILPGTTASGQQTTLGVMGGGQLGRMFVQAAQAMGYFTAVLDPDPASPAGLVSHFHIQTDYLDEQGLAQLMQRCAAITTEFENVPAPALFTLGAHRPVAPGADAVAIAQDRSAEKAHFLRCGVPVAPYAVIETSEQLAALIEEPSAAPGRPKQASAPSGLSAAATDVPAHIRTARRGPDSGGDTSSAVHELTSVGAYLFPGILKTARLGYDGKGQVRVATPAELAAAWDALKNVPCVLEKMLPLAAECSVIVARSADGTMVHFHPQLNLHRDGILAVTQVFEGNLPLPSVERAVSATKAIANELQYVGVLCVEFFVLDDGSLVVNEMAPRPHNSGHYTLDACDVSQFELQVRALTGLPLVPPRHHSPAIMLNLLGDLWFDAAGRPITPAWREVLALPGAHLHLYGKLDARKGRKMGHLTLTGDSVEAVRATALQAASLLGIPAF